MERENEKETHPGTEKGKRIQITENIDELDLLGHIDHYWKKVELRSNLKYQDPNLSYQIIEYAAFYERAKNYWKKMPPTISSMIGGNDIIHTIDIISSQMFLTDILDSNSGLRRLHALDCGAGIGRVTKNLLIPLFKRIDVVEQNSTYIDNLIQYVGAFDCRKIDQIYHFPLQKFHPELKKYDVVWCQWILSHLTNSDLYQFLQRIRKSLNKNGILIIKENSTSSGRMEVDTIDSTIIRPINIYRNFLKRIGFRTYRMARQNNLPDNVYPVYMLASVLVN